MFRCNAVPGALLALVILQGCSAHQVGKAGALTLGAGAVATGAGVCMTLGACLDTDNVEVGAPRTPAGGTRPASSNPTAGVVTIAGGLTVMVVGGVMLGVADSAAQKKP